MPVRNPFVDSNPFANEDWTGLGIPRPKQPTFDPLKPEEAEPLKDKLINKGLSGLSYIGGTLDKAFGARALRGIAMGDWNEAKSIIPFSDTLGITDPSKSHSMDEVLQHHNVVQANDPDKWELRDFLVPAAEIAADPGTYLSFGSSALTRAGRVAKNAGALPAAHRAAIEGFHATEPALRALGHTGDEIAHATRAGSRIAPEAVADAGVKAGQPLAGLVGVGLPFRDPVFTVGHGQVSKAVAGGFDAAKQAIKYAPGIRGARALLDPKAGRAFDATAQQASEFGARPVTREIDAAAHRLEHRARFDLEPIANGPGVPQGAEREITRLLRQRGESIAQANNQGLWRDDFIRRHGEGLTPGVTDPTAVADHVLANWDPITQMGDHFGQQNRTWLDQAQSMGAKGADASDDMADYMLRRLTAATHQPGAGSGGTRMFKPETPSDMARKSIFKVPGATEMVNELSIDPRISGLSRSLSADDARAEVIDRLTRQVQSEGNLLTLTPERNAVMRSRGNGLAGFLGKLPDTHATGGVPVFDPDPIAAMLTRGQRQAEQVGNLSGLYHGAGLAAVPFDPRNPAPGMVPLNRFLDDAGLKTRVETVPGTMQTQAPLQSFDGAAVRMYDQLARHGVPYQDFSIPGGSPFETLNHFAIPQAKADALRQFMPGWSPKPHEIGPITKAYDAASTVFKNAVYPLWPASHVRNAVGAAYNHAINGGGIGEAFDAARVMRGQGLRDAAAYAHVDPRFAGLAPADQARMLHELAYAHGKVFQGAGGMAELVGRHGLEPIAETIADGGRLLPRVPGDSSHLFGPRGVVAEAQQRGRAALDPRGQAGVFGRTEDTFAPLVAGRRVGTNIEDFARMSTFLGGLRRGMTPEMAGELVNKVHFDYSDLTRFEKEVGRRAFPFYTFARKNLPEQASILATHPGNLSAPIKALTNVDENRQGFVPEYLSSGVAIPMGHTEGVDSAGNPKTYSRFLNKVGLPFEEAFERLKFRNNAPAPLATAMSYLGGSNPYIKAPLEAMTDTQFHTGRHLSDLRSEGIAGGLGLLPPEVAQPLTQIVANSPLARFATTTDKAIDPRKGLAIKAMNLLTGLGVTDVDVNRLREVEARKELEAQLHRNPQVRQFTNLYVPAGQAKALTPEATQLMQLYTGMKDDAKKAAEAKAKAEKLRSIIGPSPF